MLVLSIPLVWRLDSMGGTVCFQFRLKSWEGLSGYGFAVLSIGAIWAAHCHWVPVGPLSDESVPGVNGVSIGGWVIGDLVESLFKRSGDARFGGYLPGMGGILMFSTVWSLQHWPVSICGFTY